MLGQVIDRYTLVEKLGSGGMGEVYKGHHATLDHYRAVKVLPPHLSQNPELVERFLREAKRGAALNHPNIVRLEHVGQKDGFHYLVMDYIPGRNLRQLIDDYGPLSPELAVRILVQICRALAYAHQAGVIHRDVKPSNILVDESGRAVLSDFGVARWSASEDSALTGAGVTLGTPEYASPEQIRGDSIDGRSDLYSLGVVLYEALTCEIPFRARLRNNVRRQQLDKTPDPPRFYNPAIPAALDRIILKALAKNPDERYGSATELETALREAIGLPSPQVAPSEPPPVAVASEPGTIAGTTSNDEVGVASEGPRRDQDSVAARERTSDSTDNPDPTPIDNPRYTGPEPPAAVTAAPKTSVPPRAPIPPKAPTGPAPQWPTSWPEARQRGTEAWQRGTETWQHWTAHWRQLPESTREQHVAIVTGVGLLVFVFAAVLSLDRLVSAGAAGRFTAEKGVDPKSGKEYGIVRAHGMPVIVLTQPANDMKPAQRAVWTAERLERLLAGARGGPLLPEQIEVMHDARGALVLARHPKNANSEVPDPDDIVVTVDAPTASTYAGTNRTSLALWWRDVLRDQLRLARGRPPVFTYNTSYATALDQVYQKVETRRQGSWIPPGTIRSAIKGLSPKLRESLDEAWHTVPAAWRAGGPEPTAPSRGVTPAAAVSSSERPSIRRENVVASDSIPGLSALSVIDGNPRTTWQSRQGTRFAGQRHWLKITVPPGARVGELEVQEGKRGNPRSQFRIKQIKATFSDGSFQRLSRNTPTEPLRFSLAPRSTNWVKLEVEQVFANPRPRVAHLCISEVQLWEPKAPAQTLSVRR